MSSPEWQRPAWERGRFLCPHTDDPERSLKYCREKLAQAARRLELARKRGAYHRSANALARLARDVPALRREVRELIIECRARAGHQPTVARCTWVAQIREIRKSVRRTMEWLGGQWAECEARAGSIRRGTRADGRPYSSRAVLHSYAATVREFPELYAQKLADLPAMLATVRTYDEFRAALGQRSKGHLRLAWSRQIEGLGQENAP